jgi:hypothetical protein
MKIRIVIISFLVFCSIHAYSQDSLKTDGFEMKTILQQGDKKFRFYGDVWVGFDRMLSSSSNGVSLGANLAWLAGRSLGIGVAFTALQPEGSWYCGGLFIEPIIKPNHWVHVSFPSMIGVGYGPKKRKSFSTLLTEETARNNFIYLEPGVQAEFNPWKVMRLGIGVKLHLAIDNKRPLYYDFPLANEMNGFSIFLSIKFGKFN